MNDKLDAQLLAHELLLQNVLLLSAMANPEPKHHLEHIQQSLATLTPMVVAKRNLSPEVGDLALKHINSFMDTALKALPQKLGVLRRD